MDDQWPEDLVDIQALSRENNGTKYLLTCSDAFSKYALVVPIREKSADVVLEALKDLLQQPAPRRPHRFQTDKGREFLNTQVQDFLRSHAPSPIEHFTTWSDMKAALVEQFNRTLKTRMWQYFTKHHTHHYLDVLPQLAVSKIIY